MCSCVCFVLAWRCFGWRRLRRHGWREWAGLWGVRVGGAEEDQSYGFAGRRLQRYLVAVRCQCVDTRVQSSSRVTHWPFSAPQWRSATAVRGSPSPLSVRLHLCCARSSIIHRPCPPPVPFPPWDCCWTRPGSCNGGGAAVTGPRSARARPRTTLCARKRKTHLAGQLTRWSLLCARVCAPRNAIIELDWRAGHWRTQQQLHDTTH